MNQSCHGWTLVPALIGALALAGCTGGRFAGNGAAGSSRTASSATGGSTGGAGTGGSTSGSSTSGGSTSGGSTSGNGTSPPKTYAVGGSVTGLIVGQGVGLLDNGTSPIGISANGAFSFSTQLASGSSYSVTVGTQPSGETCTVVQGSGTVNSAAVTNIAVTCTPTYSIGGTISGLSASGLVLKNGSDTLTVSAGATSFTMRTRVTSGSTYSVTVGTQPSGETCSVSQGSGSVGAANVTNVDVTCTLNHYTIGGSISGITTSGLVLANGSDTLTVSAGATTFTMPISVTSGSAYDVMVNTHPVGTICNVVSGAGTVANANVTDISITCQSAAESILYSFAGGTGDGALPRGGIIEGSDGNFYGMTQNGGPNNYGVIFVLTPTGTESVLHFFAGGSDGAQPFGDLIQGSDGNFYGMTNIGGTSNDGVIFQYVPGGAESVLHTFTGAPGDGRLPGGNLIQDSYGDFYGVAWQGGSNDDGIIFKLTTAATETVLHSFAGSDGNNPLGSLVRGVDGNFYGMASAGGTNGLGVIFMVTAAGAETVLHNFSGGTDGGNPYGNLILASDGNFYGMTANGGAGNTGVVFKVTPTGTETVLYAFGGANGETPWGSLIQDSSGNFYGMTYAGGASGLGVVFELTPGGAESVLRSFAGGATDGAHPYGSLFLGSDGTGYGMTSAGGASGNGTVFELK